MKRIFILLLLINMYLQSSQTAYESAFHNVIGSFSDCPNCNYLQWDMAQELFPQAKDPIFALDALHYINHLLEKDNFISNNINEIHEVDKGIAILKHFSKGNREATLLSIKDNVIEAQQEALIEQAIETQKIKKIIALQSQLIEKLETQISTQENTITAQNSLLSLQSQK